MDIGPQTDLCDIFLETVEEHLRRSNTAATAFGLNVLNDGNFIFKLRGNPKYGQRLNPTLNTISKVLEATSAYDSADSA